VASQSYAQTPQQQQMQQQQQQTQAPVFNSGYQSGFSSQADQQDTGSKQNNPGTKRSNSLFSRIAEFGGGRRNENGQSEQSSQPNNAPKLGVDPQDRPRLSSEEEKLEIPAFLRRQSN
jgi:cell division protein FtsZ